MLHSQDAAYSPPETEAAVTKGAASARERSDRATAAPGLVHLETSAKWNPLDPASQQRRRMSRMRRAVTTAAAVLTEGLQKGGFRYRCVMVTLTYRPGVNWHPRHLPELLDRARKWLAIRRQKLRYVWVAELQYRGAVHYHLVIWLPRGLTLPKPDKQGWWPHGSTRIEWARKPVGYLAKYASKGDWSDGGGPRFPRGLRLHGRGGLERDQRRVVSWWVLPRYVREYFTEVGAIVRRALGGGWVDELTGEWIPGWSPLREAPA